MVLHTHNKSDWPTVSAAELVPNRDTDLRHPGELPLEPLLLLLERETRGRVELLHAPAALPVKLQEVVVKLPATHKGFAASIRLSFSHSSQSVDLVLFHVADNGRGMSGAEMSNQPTDEFAQKIISPDGIKDQEVISWLQVVCNQMNFSI